MITEQLQRLIQNTTEDNINGPYNKGTIFHSYKRKIENSNTKVDKLHETQHIIWNTYEACPKGFYHMTSRLGVK